MSFYRTSTIRIGESSLEGGILALETFGKGTQVRNPAVESRLQPGVKLVWLAGAHHRAKALCQIVSDLNSRFLTDEGQHLLFLVG